MTTAGRIAINLAVNIDDPQRMNANDDVVNPLDIAIIISYTKMSIHIPF